MNSKRLMAAYIKAIARNMELPTNASTDEVRQLIEGKLEEEGREPRNVQVIVQEPLEGTRDAAREYARLFLVDETGVFREVEVSAPVTTETAEMTSLSQADGLEEEPEDISLELEQRTAELEAANLQLEEAADTIKSKQSEIERLEKELRQEKERYKQLWRISCDNLAEHDCTHSACEVTSSIVHTTPSA